MSADRFAAGSFGQDDVDLFGKFVSHLERALSNAQFILRARQFRNFDEETAKATGKSKRTVERDKARGEAIPADVLARITGSDLDKGTYLDKLRELSRDEQRERVDRDLEAIDRRKNDARLKEEETRRKEEAKEGRRRDFADMGELLDKRLSSEECEWFLNALAKYAGKAANDLRAWTNT